MGQRAYKNSSGKPTYLKRIYFCWVEKKWRLKIETSLGKKGPGSSGSSWGFGKKKCWSSVVNVSNEKINKAQESGFKNSETHCPGNAWFLRMQNRLNLIKTVNANSYH